MYSTWNTRALREELKKRGASVHGRKADLIERFSSNELYLPLLNETVTKNVCAWRLRAIEAKLFAYKLERCLKDYSYGSIKNDLNIKDTGVSWPPLHAYCDIILSTPLPPLTKMHITQYFSSTNKELIEAKTLYESRYLLNAKCCMVGDETFVKGHCKKTMKGLHYEVDIKFEKNGTPEQSHCMCPAGSRPAARCKHVAVLLHAVENMANDKVMLINEMATQKSQSIHALKHHYTPSLMTVNRFPLKRSHHTFSPYTVIKKDEYDDKMPFMELSEAENPYTVVEDDAHTSHQAENETLRKLKLINVDEDIVKSMELATRGQPGRAAWYRERRHRLTASNFYKICHLRESTKASYSKKLVNKKTFSSRPVVQGILNETTELTETTAFNEYVTKYELNVKPCGLFISKEKPYLAASPDGLLGEDAIVEIKCPNSSRNQKITPNTVPYLIQDSLNNLALKETSPCYYEVQGQLYCTGRQFCNLIVYTYEEMKVIFVSRDEIFIKCMLAKLDHFYEHYFRGDILNNYCDYDIDMM